MLDVVFVQGNADLKDEQQIIDPRLGRRSEATFSKSQEDNTIITDNNDTWRFQILSMCFQAILKGQSL